MFYYIAKLFYFNDVQLSLRIALCTSSCRLNFIILANRINCRYLFLKQVWFAINKVKFEYILSIRAVVVACDFLKKPFIRFMFYFIVTNGMRVNNRNGFLFVNVPNAKLCFISASWFKYLEASIRNRNRCPWVVVESKMWSILNYDNWKKFRSILSPADLTLKLTSALKWSDSYNLIYLSHECVWWILYDLINFLKF